MENPKAMANKFLPTVVVLLTTVFFFSCNTASDKDYASTAEAMADTTRLAADLGLDAVNSAKRKIIHTADINCKVNDVLKVTMLLESSTKKLQGVVTESTLKHEQLHSTQLPYTADSLREITTYQTSSLLRLRVPVQYRDSLINMLPALVSFVDSRQLLQTDATLDYFSDALKTKASTVLTNKAEARASTTKDLISTADRAESNIDHLVEQYRIDDAVAFSTITINLYQPVQTSSMHIVNAEAALKIPFTTSLSESLRSGLYLLE
ncbi:MAG: DUF4349 domain-containing protein, partial [Chitinophagaceae bacterium]